MLEDKLGAGQGDANAVGGSDDDSKPGKCTGAKSTDGDVPDTEKDTDARESQNADASAANFGTEVQKAVVEADGSNSARASEVTGPVLIVCPASLVQQWKSELLTWAHFEVGVCDGKRKEQVLSAVEGGELEVIVCSYTCYYQVHNRLNSVDWELVIFDEAHTIK